MNLKATVIFVFCFLSILSSSFFEEDQNNSTETFELNLKSLKENNQAEAEMDVKLDSKIFFNTN